LFDGVLMKKFKFSIFTDIVFGSGVMSEVAERVKGLGIKKPFIVTDNFLSGTTKFKEMVENIRKGGLNPTVWGNAVPDPTDVSVNEGIKVYRTGDCDGLIGYGGGSSMDTAKAIGVLAYHKDDDIRNYFGRPPHRKKPLKGMKPLVCLPTTSGTGSEVTRVAMITDTLAKKKKGVGGSFVAPKVAIVDPVLTVTMPSKITASTGMDAFSHAIEYYSGIKTNPLSDAFAVEAIKLISANLREAVYNGENLFARTNMSLAALMAGIAFNNGVLHLVHAVGHTLGNVYHCSHGIGCSLLLPEILEFILPARIDKLAGLAPFFGINSQGLSPRKAAEETVDAISQMMKDVGIPSLAEVKGASPKDVNLLAENTMEEGLTKMSPRKTSKDDYDKMFQKAFNKKN
jgi:alcohol dehydrogenase